MSEPQRIELIEPAETSARHLSRKWLLALLVIAAASGLLWAGRIDGARWGEVVIWITGLYMLGNGATAWAAVWGRR